MPSLDQKQLSRRERQIMDILFEVGACSAHEVLEKLPDPPGYSAVRALIARLVEKNLVEFRLDGTRHIYSPRVEPKKARDSAIKQLLKTFFKGSRVNAVNALLDMDAGKLSDAEIAQLERTIERIKKVDKNKK